jgi:hypothetical protein
MLTRPNSVLKSEVDNARADAKARPENESAKVLVTPATLTCSVVMTVPVVVVVVLVDILGVEVGAAPIRRHANNPTRKTEN